MIDIDADWNPEECSLDEHRMKKLATLEQPGFGIHAKPKAEASISAVAEDDEDDDDATDIGED